MQHRFEDLELPKEEKLYPSHDAEEQHPLKDDEWMFEVDSLMTTISYAVKDLKEQLGYLADSTIVMRKFKYLRNIIREYGSHKKSCKYLNEIEVPRIGEEHKLCNCGWVKLRSQLQRNEPRRYY